MRGQVELTANPDDFHGRVNYSTLEGESQAAYNFNKYCGWFVVLGKVDPLNLLIGCLSTVSHLFLFASAIEMIVNNVAAEVVVLSFFSVGVGLMLVAVVLPCSYYNNWVGLICAGCILGLLGVCLNGAMLTFFWGDYDKLGSATGPFITGAFGGLICDFLFLPSICLRYYFIRQQEHHAFGPIDGQRCKWIFIALILISLPVALELAMLFYISETILRPPKD